MKIRFYNARILTMAEDCGILWGEVWVEEGRITCVGDRANRKPPVWNREIDAEGNLLMPGFKDAHTHSGMTFLRSYADDLPLKEWLDQKVFPMEQHLTPEDIYHLDKLAILEYLTSGITANFDMYLAPEAMAQAAADCGFRTVLCGPVNDFTQSVQQMEKDYKRFSQYHDRVSYRLGFHAEYTTSERILREIAALAKDFRAPVFMHLSETRQEVADCIRRHGMTPPAYLEHLGMFEHGGGGFHCVHLTEADREILKEKGVWAVLNPASNLKLASGLAPIQEMADTGISLALGTDGPASNNCLDMFREMFLVTGLAKLREGDAAAMDALSVLRMATTDGARMLGLDACDTLEVGKRADLIMLDLQQPNMQPLNHIEKNIVYSGSKQNVKLTMVDGRILYEAGRFFIGTEPGEIYEKASEILRKLEKEKENI